MSNKLFKSELKSIVKECLIEILSEGLLPNRQSTLSFSSKNTLSEKKNRLKSVNKRPVKKQVKMDTNLTSNNILNEMLADTAVSTLQKQINAERKNTATVVGNDLASKTVSESTPEELFGEQSSKWASLAFSN